MLKYQILVDPRAEETRKKMRQQRPRMLAKGTMKLALHLSDVEHEYLLKNNPDLTLDGEDGKREWAKFIEHPDSAAFRVQRI